MWEYLVGTAFVIVAIVAASAVASVVVVGTTALWVAGGAGAAGAIGVAIIRDAYRSNDNTQSNLDREEQIAAQNLARANSKDEVLPAVEQPVTQKQLEERFNAMQNDFDAKFKKLEDQRKVDTELADVINPAVIRRINDVQGQVLAINNNQITQQVSANLISPEPDGIPKRGMRR